MKNSNLLSLDKGAYHSPDMDVYPVDLKSVICGTNGTTENYGSQDPWDSSDNDD